jgi:hypothetical protein
MITCHLKMADYRLHEKMLSTTADYDYPKSDSCGSTSNMYM